MNTTKTKTDMSQYYLYAAAVQGIQDFIFKTNKLKHIIGASELVEQICTSAFEDFEEEGGEDVVRAAGNIKYIFKDPEACKKAFREFPKKIMTMAPGITVSQAIAVFEEDARFGDAVDKVERMLKVQRNKPPKSVLSGLMGIKRTNNTGLPATHEIKEKKDGKDVTTLLDDATYEKIKACGPDLPLAKKSFGTKVAKSNPVPEISDITGGNDWIAIVHADGNGVGKVVQAIGKEKGIFSEFSRKLGEATVTAAQAAFEEVQYRFYESAVIPIRPVVLSGDDMTVILRGDLAIEYTKAFILAFEQKTEDLLGDILKQKKVFSDGKIHLTACAGIAFIKSSYPFYYGYQLAEELCSHAKKDTKKLSGENNLPDSCLMFHKVQDSFVIDYNTIVDRELTVTDNGVPHPLFKAGPYYCNAFNGRHTVKELTDLADRLDKESENGVKSGVRNWISLRLKGKDKAEQRRLRMAQVFDADGAELLECLTRETDGENPTCIAYDVLAYHTVLNQKTNNDRS